MLFDPIKAEFTPTKGKLPFKEMLIGIHYHAVLDTNSNSVYAVGSIGRSYDCDMALIKYDVDK